MGYVGGGRGPDNEESPGSPIGLIVILSITLSVATITIIVVVTILRRKRKAAELRFLVTEESAPPVDPQKPATCRFLMKLRRMLTSYPHIVTWSEDGSYFCVQSIPAFEAQVLTDKALGIKASSYKNWNRSLVNFQFKTVRLARQSHAYIPRRT